MKKNANASCRIIGRACHSSAGASNSASTGEVSRICPATTANSTMNAIHLSTRASRKRVQSENRRFIARSKPPNTPFVQNRW